MKPTAPPGAGRARAPLSAPSPSYSRGHHAGSPNQANWPDEDEIEQPIAGHMGPGTVIACAVEAELWPAWTDAVAFMTTKGVRS